MSRDMCRYCKRPERAHCKGCGSCFPYVYCAPECDVNEAHDGGDYDKRNFG